MLSHFVYISRCCLDDLTSALLFEEEDSFPRLPIRFRDVNETRSALTEEENKKNDNDKKAAARKISKLTQSLEEKLKSSEIKKKTAVLEVEATVSFWIIPN